MSLTPLPCQQVAGARRTIDCTVRTAAGSVPRVYQDVSVEIFTEDGSKKIEFARISALGLENLLGPYIVRHKGQPKWTTTEFVGLSDGVHLEAMRLGAKVLLPKQVYSCLRQILGLSQALIGIWQEGTAFLGQSVLLSWVRAVLRLLSNWIGSSESPWST